MFRALKELWKRLDLVKFLVIGKLKTTHKNMVLGYLWWLLTPLLWVVVYWLLVSVIFERGKPHYPLFLACAILPWRAFAVSIGQSITSVTGQKGLITQLSFPRSVFPVSVTLSNAINLFFSILVLILIAYVYGITPSGNLIYLPLILVTQLTFTLALTFFLSIIGVYFADIQNMLQFILRIWLYLSPALYSVDRIPVRFRSLFMLNPFAPIFIGYRNVIMYNTAPPLNTLLVSFAVSLTALVCGFWLFFQQEPKLAKAI